MTTEQFSLKWNNFHSNLTTGFHGLYRTEDLVDVTLAAGGHFIQAHKLVLSVCSPYFRELFKANPCKHPIVILKDVGHAELRNILEFMYLGEVNVLRDNLTTFLKTAELLQVKGLTGDDTTESTIDDAQTKNESNTSSRSNCEYPVYNEPLVDIDFAEADAEIAVADDICDSATATATAAAAATTAAAAAAADEEEDEAPVQKPSVVENHKGSNAHLPMKTSSGIPAKRWKSEQQQPIVDDPGPDAQPYELTRTKQEPAEFENGDEKIDKTFGEETKDGLQIQVQDATGYMADQGYYYATERKAVVMCPICQKHFVNRYNLKVHIRDKHGREQLIACDICGKVMRNQSCLRVHMYNHRRQSSI